MRKLLIIFIIPFLFIYFQSCYTKFHPPRTEAERVHEEERVDRYDSEYQDYIFESPNIHNHFYGNHYGDPFFNYHRPYYSHFPRFSMYSHFGMRRPYYYMRFSYGTPYYHRYNRYSYYHPFGHSFYDPFYASFYDPFYSPYYDSYYYGYGSYYSYGYYGSYYSWGYPDYYYTSGTSSKRKRDARPADTKGRSRGQKQNSQNYRQRYTDGNFRDNALQDDQPKSWEVYEKSSATGNKTGQKDKDRSSNVDIDPPKLPAERTVEVKDFNKDNFKVPQKDPDINSNPRVINREGIIRIIDRDNQQTTIGKKLKPVKPEKATRYKYNSYRNKNRSSSNNRSSSYNRSRSSYRSSSSSSSNSSSSRSSSSRSMRSRSSSSSSSSSSRSRSSSSSSNRSGGSRSRRKKK